MDLRSAAAPFFNKNKCKSINNQEFIYKNMSGEFRHLYLPGQIPAINNFQFHDSTVFFCSFT